MDFFNEYSVFCNGSLMYHSSNKKPALRKAMALSKKKSNYVEVVYRYTSGKDVVVAYFN